MAVEFPITGEAESEREAQRLLHELEPALVVPVERAGVSAGGSYHNAQGGDITRHTARLGSLFRHHPATVGIGDGGNEIGMGRLYDQILRTPTLAPVPAVTTTTHLLVAATANWGAYGLIAPLSRLCGRDLLPDSRGAGAADQLAGGAGGGRGLVCAGGARCRRVHAGRQPANPDAIA